MGKANEVRDDRRYSKDHEWALVDGDEIVVGISAFAVDQLGDITLVNLDVSDGDEVEQGAVFGTIESVKTLSDLYAPVSGTVTRVNPDLEDAPELINDDPWRKGWMLAITPNNTSELDGLMDSASYGEFLEDSDH
jgi:glycine cleavage system H protein